MTTRNTAVGSKSSSDYLTAANYNDGAGGLIGRATMSSNQTGITTEVALSGLTLTLTPNASRMIRLEYSIQFTGNTNGDAIRVNIYKDAVLFDAVNFAISTVDQVTTVNRAVVDIGPTNASHTYLLKAQRSASSSGTFAVSAASTTVAWFMISDVGPQF